MNKGCCGLGPYNGKIPLNPTLIDESELKECNRIKFVRSAAGIITPQSPSFCALISSSKEEHSGRILTIALNLTLI